MTRRRGALPRFLARGAAVIALFVVFAVSLVAGALLHMNLSLGRRMAARVANHALAGLSSGPVKLTEIERLTLGRIEVRRVEADIAGAGHGRAELVRARVDWWRTLFATLHERRVTSIYVTDVEAALVDFELRVEPKPAPAPAGPEAPSRELRLEVGRLAVEHAYLKGALPGGQVVDLDLDCLRANLSLDGTRLRAGVSTGATVRAILLQPIELEIEANASLPLGTSSIAPRSPVGDFPGSSGSMNLHGRAGELRFDARGALLADTVDIEVIVPEAEPDAIRALWEAAPFTQPVSARVRAGGTWPRLDARLEVTAGTGVLHAEGRVNLEGRARVDATLSARNVDLRALFEGAPRSSIALDGRVELSEVEARRGGIPLEGTLSLSTLGGSIAGEPLPRVDGRLTIDPAASLRVTASVDEPGAPLRVEAIRTRDGSIHASVEGSVPSLAEAPRLARFGISGTGRAVLRGEGSLTGDVVSSEVIADVYRMGFGKFAVGAGRLQLRIQGALAEPRLAAFAHLIAVRHEPFAVNDLLIRAEGSTDAFDVTVAGRGGTLDVVALQSAVHLADGIEVRGLSARLERETQTVVLGAERLALGRAAFQIEGLSIEGLGAPVRIDAHRASGVVKADVSAPEFDLARLSALIGASTERFAGRGSMNLSLEIDGDRSFAEGHAVLEGGVFGTLPRLDAALDVGIDGAAVQALFSARNPELGGIHLEAGGTLGGSLLDPRSFVRSTGRVALSTDRISLRLVCGAIPCPTLLRQAGASMGLTLQGNVEAERDRTSPDGDTRLHLRIDANDTRGPVAFVEASSQVDLVRALVDRTLPNDAPLEASFGIEPRSLDGLPADLRPTGLSGAVQFHGYAEGTIGQPFLVLEVAANGMRYGAQRPDVPALDVKWVTTYDLEQAASEIQVYAGSRRVVDATAQVEASLEKLLAGGDRGWNGGLYVELDRFPLSFVPHEADQRMTGAVTGKVSASGLHASPRIDVHLAVDELRVGRVSAGPVVLGLLASETDCTGALDTGAATGGFAGAGSASVRATAGCAWKDATWPSLDPNVPIRVWLDAAQFPLGSAAPLVDGTIERLGGTLDAHLRATGATEGDGRRWRIAGAAHVRDGNLLPLDIGREFKHLQIDFGAAEDGTVRVERFSGEVGAGRFDATGQFMLRDLGIEKGQADFHIPRRQAIPMTIEGVSYGLMWGDIHADAKLVNDELHINLHAPTLRVDLPPQRNAALESLDDNPAVSVLQPLGPTPPPAAVGGGPAERVLPSRVVIRLELGDNVGISREDMKIELNTPPPPANPTITFDGGVELHGSIRILGGRVPVAGRVFRIEHGIVRFIGADPTNPALDIDAVYEGADTSGTRIDVHVGGTARDIKLSLRSSPAKPESELLGILAFGEPAPGAGLGASQTGAAGSVGGAAAAGAAAVGVGSAILTTGINQILSQSIFPVRTRVLTGSSTLASASLELTERVRFEYIRQFGTVRYGQPQDVNQFALDWRFKPRWLVRAVVGDRGTTTLDVLWNRWY